MNTYIDLKRLTSSAAVLPLILTGAVFLSEAQGEPIQSPVVGENHEDPQIPAMTVTTEGGQIHIQVEGISWKHVRKLSWGQESITQAIKQALAEKTAKINKTPSGFELVIDDPSILSHIEGEGLLTMTLSTGSALSAYAVIERVERAAAKAFATASCPWLTFSAPTKTSANSNCSYGSKNCFDKSNYHAGIDWNYSSSNPDAYAVADGKVVRVETKSSSDHGMGNNIIISHTLSNCSTVYSTYSHLDSIDGKITVGSKVSRGQRIGKMGGSGYGKSGYWSKHLHEEIKRSAVTGTPWSYSGTCKSGCWGYTPYHPDNYGYTNPASY